MNDPWGCGEAYPCTLSQDWGSYNVEQQGKLVQDWFDPNIGNRLAADARFPYIWGVILGHGQQPLFVARWSYQDPSSFKKVAR